jgi:hypothetical protein
MAVLSLVAGILGLTMLPVIGSIVAVITGPMAKREIFDSGGTLGGEGLAQAGIVMGWIGISLAVLGICIFGVLVAIPFCLAAFGLASGEWSSVLPVIVGAL